MCIYPPEPEQNLSSVPDLITHIHQNEGKKESHETRNQTLGRVTEMVKHVKVHTDNLNRRLLYHLVIQRSNQTLFFCFTDLFVSKQFDLSPCPYVLESLHGFTTALKGCRVHSGNKKVRRHEDAAVSSTLPDTWL